METYIENEITNCGLIALRNMSSLRDVSIRTLIALAEDNRLHLYAYKISLSEMPDVLPAIIHTENHFVYAESIDDFIKFKVTGNILTTQKLDYQEIPTEELRFITGATWAFAVAGSIAATGAVYKGLRARKQKKDAEKIKPVRPVATRTNASLEREAMARQAASSTRLPGQGYAENQIGAQTARSSNAINQTGGSSGEIIAGLTNVDDNARRSTNDLNFQGAQLNQENKQLYSNVLKDVSAEQDEIFDYNLNQPFQTETLRKQALLDSSQRNADNAFSDAQDAGSNFGSAGISYGANSATRKANRGR
jgi:hypothetical protein